MVAGNQHHALAVAGAAQQLLDDGVLRRRPVDAAAHGPEIDDVADQEDVIGGMFAEELEETFRLARAGAEVDVRRKSERTCGMAEMLRHADHGTMKALLQLRVRGWVRPASRRARDHVGAADDQRIEVADTLHVLVA